MFKLLARAYADVHPMMMDRSENRCGGNFLKRGSIINGADWYSFTGGADGAGGLGGRGGLVEGGEIEEGLEGGGSISFQQLFLGPGSWDFWNWGSSTGAHIQVLARPMDTIITGVQARRGPEAWPPGASVAATCHMYLQGTGLLLTLRGAHGSEREPEDMGA